MFSMACQLESTCELLQSGKIEIGHRHSVLYDDGPAVIEGLNWHLGTSLLTVIHIRGVTVFGNIITSC